MTIQRIYRLWQLGCRRIVASRIDDYGPSFWNHLIIFLDATFSNPEDRYRVLSEIIVSYEHRRTWISI
jgi:hypothetical protein